MDLLWMINERAITMKNPSIKLKPKKNLKIKLNTDEKGESFIQS